MSVSPPPLPEPPPPRPAARDAAIEAAMRRFDGEPRASAAPAPARRPGVSRPQIAAFATIALVAMVGLPVWLSGDHRLERVVPDAPSAAPARPAAAPAASADAAVADRAPMPGAAKQRLAARLSPVAAAPAVVAVPSRQGDKGDWAIEAPAPMPPPMPEPVPAPAMKRGSTMTGHDALAREAAAPMPSMDSADSAEVVVTGSRVAAPSAVARGRVAPLRGDWNACTVSDPSHDLGACEAAIAAAAPGPAGRAAAHFADGLLSAWQGDYGGAVAAFDRAIEITPRNAAAYLNRGMAYARRGMIAHAIDDVDRAVRYAPRAARGYYQRSLLLRRRGDNALADADLRRAVALDSSYQAFVR